jgi:uncharacterized protein (UPF0276 family)
MGEISAIPNLGVGLVFAPALRPFLAAHPTLVDFLEIEPQTLWLADDPLHGPFFECKPALDEIATLPGRRLVHSVGVPLGGRRSPDPGQCHLIRSLAERLDSPWVSEHLSMGGTINHASGFFLPPLQTLAGVRQCVSNIREFQRAIGRPVAVETGASYLPRHACEMEDERFLSEVVESADCGILLDLHNLYCNHRNGRINLERFLSQVPLERVWEVHLAGGHNDRGFWLDSHCGPMPSELRRIAADIIPHLPNLGALTFEIYDTFIKQFDLTDLEIIATDLRELWHRSRKCCDIFASIQYTNKIEFFSSSPGLPERHQEPDCEMWEQGLTEAVWKNDAKLHCDPNSFKSLDLYSWLARSFRGSMLARSLPHAIRYLLLRDGADTDNLFANYFTAVSPRLYAPLEAEAFHKWIIEYDKDELLKALLSFDVAQLRIIRSGEPQIVEFPGNPATMFDDLAKARLPDMPSPPAWEIELVPDGFTLKDWT